MSILLQQIRRSTYSRKGTAAALTPPNTFSRVFSTNRALGPEKEETFAEILGKNVLKYGLTGSFIYGTFYWVDYGGYRKTKEKWEELEAESKRERKAFSKAKVQLDYWREKAKGEYRK